MATTRFLRQIAPHQASFGLPRAERPLVAIGDIQGCDLLLDRMLAHLAAQPDAAQIHLICLGDMIGKGPDGAAVLRRLRALCQNSVPFANCLCLMGDHERLLLNFLADPLCYGATWLRKCGGETAASFGLRPIPPKWVRKDTTAMTALVLDLHHDLTSALPQGLRDWITDLPQIWRSGAIAFSHAGANPRMRLEDQPEASLLSTHPDFRRRPRQDGIWMVHGHLATATPVAAKGRVSINTDAWRTGRLTAAMFGSDAPQFLTVPETGAAILGRFACETVRPRLHG